MSVFGAISPKDWSDSVGALRLVTYGAFILSPDQWKKYPNRVPNLKWKRKRFTKKSVATLPNERGVYSFVAQPQIAGHTAVGYLLYVGEAHSQTLKERCSDYFNESKKPNRRIHILEMLRRWPDHLWLYYAAVSDISQIELLEQDLIAAFLPPFNRKFPAEVRELRAAALS